MFDTEQAACKNSDPEMFFPDSKTFSVKVRAAKAICATCPVALQCLAEALYHTEAGIWGGTTETERRAIRGQKRIDILKHLQ
jgi:WhiB family redox-sensing transcriptional regulator